LNLKNIKRDKRKMEKEIKRILEIEREARKTLEDTEKEADALKESAEKESRKIIMRAKKEAGAIIDGYKSNLLKTKEKEKKKVEEKGMSLRDDWMKRYESMRKELLTELTSFLLKKQ